jgi:hypothetical protein
LCAVALFGGVVLLCKTVTSAVAVVLIHAVVLDRTDTNAVCSHTQHFNITQRCAACFGSSGTFITDV